MLRNYKWLFTRETDAYFRTRTRGAPRSWGSAVRIEYDHDYEYDYEYELKSYSDSALRYSYS